MAVIVLRIPKGSPLTNLELDNNFSNINSEVTVNTSNIGVMSQLTTTNKGNLVAAVNEVYAAVDNRIANGTSNIAINTVNGNIIASVDGKIAFTVSNVGGNANIIVNGDVTANIGRITTLQDRRGNVLVIKNESGVVIWGE